LPTLSPSQCGTNMFTYILLSVSMPPYISIIKDRIWAAVLVTILADISIDFWYKNYTNSRLSNVPSCPFSVLYSTI
jgi:hypothetical protein